MSLRGVSGDMRRARKRHRRIFLRHHEKRE